MSVKSLKSGIVFFLVTVLSAAAVSCTEDLLSVQSPASGTPEAKIINTKSMAQSGSLLLCLKPEASTKARAFGTQPASSRMTSGMADMDSVFSSLDVTLFERIFPAANEKEEMLARKYGLDRWYRIRFPENKDIEKAAKSVAGLDNVEYLQYNTVSMRASDGVSSAYRPFSTKAVSGSFNDEMLSAQWHYRNTGDAAIASYIKTGADINVTDAWRLTAGHPEVVVAVIDEAVQYNHPDLKDNIWVNPNPGQGKYHDDIHGYNFAADSPEIKWDNYGDSGHGTHVAGTVAAVNNNGQGVCGVAGGTGNGDGVRIMCLQVMAGGGAAADVTSEAIWYALNHGAHIIQCSWGNDSGTITSDKAFESGWSSSVIAEAINAFVSEPNDILDGGLAIFAAGNEAKAMSGYPAAYHECISVTSFSPDYRPAYYTNYDLGCNIAAPGGEIYPDGVYSEKTQILSTMPTVALPIIGVDGQPTGQYSAKDYGYMQGTSMACPHVSGVAALGLSYAKELGRTFTRDEFTAMLLTSVNDIDKYITGSKRTLLLDRNQIGMLNLFPYKGKMGTGSIDAWRLLMNVEGTPCLTVEVGVEQKLDLKDYFGASAATLAFTGVEMTSEDKAALGLAEDPVVKYGKLNIAPMKAGAAKLRITAIAGGATEGGSDIGGTPITREISVIARNIPHGNGGWL